MSFVLFFRGMVAALLVFAVTIYLLTGSFWTAFWQTIACAVLLQVGYFVGVMLMVWRAGAEPQATVAQEEAGPSDRQGEPQTDSGKMPSRTLPHRP